MVLREKERFMRHMLELKREIETVRKKLDAAAKTEICGEDCYQLSVQLDKLIAEYMQLKEEKVQLLHCG